MHIGTDRQKLKTGDAFRFINTAAGDTVYRILDPDMSGHRIRKWVVYCWVIFLAVNKPPVLTLSLPN
jgi:hypothetical protein